MTQETNITFEAAYARLEEILEKMNAGSTSLEESLSLYEEADKLISHCNVKLNHAEKKIEMLIKGRDGELAIAEDGTPQKEEFSPGKSSCIKN
jgi:exodeoxyribonuclease VII small subunit